MKPSTTKVSRALAAKSPSAKKGGGGTESEPDRLRRQIEEQRNLLELQNEQLLEANAELEITQQRYAELYDLAPVGYITLDGRGCIREINQTARHLLGRSSVHLMGKPLVPHIAAPDRKVLLKHLWEARRCDEQVMKTIRLVASDGVERHVQLVTNRVHARGSQSNWCRTAIWDITEQQAIQTALNASEAKFRLLAENIGEIFWFMELDPTRISYVSPSFESIWGIPAAELYADHTLWEKAIFADDLKRIQDAFHRWINGETETYQTEYRVRNRHGEIRWLADRGIVTGHKDGRPRQICGIARDITERIEADAVRERLASIVESSDDAIISMDVDGTIHTWNTGAQRVFGYSAGEAIGRPMSFLAPGGDTDDGNELFDRVLRGERVEHRETQRRRKDGQIIDVSLTISPLIDTKGQVTGVSKIARDITARKRAEQKFIDLLESAPDALIITNQQGLVEMSNAQTTKLFGYTHDELIGQSVEVLIPERFRSRHAVLHAGYAANPQVRSMGLGRELFALRKDGSEVAVEISLSPLQTVNGTLFISSIRDITQRRQAEGELRESQRFAQSTLEAIPASLAVLDETGTVISANQVWRDFAKASGAPPQAVASGVNYLAACESAVGESAGEAARFAAGIREVMKGDSTQFSMEYHSRAANLKCWFIGYVTAFAGGGPPRVVIAHVDISERKRAEQVIERLNAELETRVEQRTEELKSANEELRRQIAVRRRLEEEILEISEREQQRIGQDLHDDLGQQLAGIWCLSQVHEQSLDAHKSPEIKDATKITNLLKNALALTRALARGLHPVAVQAGSLVAALDELTIRTTEVFRVNCRCKCSPTLDLDNTTATHLYRIAQEAITNAIKHGHARDIEIELSSNPLHTILSVKDNGSGISAQDPELQGMGLRIMNYRADMIGGILKIENHQPSGGTLISCTFPTPGREPSAEVPK